MEEEIWKDVEGYEGLYQVSSLGRVKSINYHSTGKEKVLKPDKNKKTGYLYVGISKNNKKKRFLIHRLVALAFIDNPENKQQIDHINTIKTDNRADNLRWVTRKENANNPISRNRLLDKSPAVKFGKDNCNSKPVYQYSLEGLFIREWGCIMDVERELGFHHGSISHCCLGHRKTCCGYKWKYAQ